MKKILLLLFFSFPFIASECDDDLFTQQSGNLAGNWQLVYNSGVLHDICPGETVRFPGNTGGIAVLKCPAQDSVARSYTVSNCILTYQETGVQYRVAEITSSSLQLDGTGPSEGRYLYYSRMTADNAGGER